MTKGIKTTTLGDLPVEAPRSNEEPSGQGTRAPAARSRSRSATVTRLGTRGAERAGIDQSAALGLAGKVVGLTRAGVAALLHVSSSTVRRLEERGELHPRVIDGVHFFDPEEIHRARAARASSAPPDGDAAAFAFELLDQGVGLRDIVKRCRVTPERARALATEWKKMGSDELVISAEVRAELSRALGTRHLSSDTLLRAVRGLVQQLDIADREFSDMQAERNAAEDLLSTEQLRELYATRRRASANASAVPR
jgi:hypothetical protein